MLFANAVYLYQQFEHTHLLTAQKRAIGVEALAKGSLVDFLRCHSF
jgi:hypothetical protein